MANSNSQQQEEVLTGYTPKHQIHVAHQQALKARQNYVSVSMSEMGQEYLKYAHQSLNRAVLRYLESMKYLLKTKDSLSNYWEGKPPAKPGADFDEGEAYLYFETESEVLQWGGKGLSAEEWQEFKDKYKEERGYRTVDRVNIVPQKNGNIGIVIQVPKYGLKRISDQWQKRKEVKDLDSGMLGTKTKSSYKPDLLPAEILMNAGTALDEAADIVGLLSDIDAEVPRTEITEEMLDDVAQWRDQNFELVPKEDD